mgnify:CR=1 FL=1
MLVFKKKLNALQTILLRLIQRQFKRQLEVHSRKELNMEKQRKKFSMNLK